MNLELVLAVSTAQAADIAAHIATVVATGVLGVWVYSRFVAQQITRPPIEFTVRGEPIGTSAEKRLIRVTFRVRNGGTRECDVWLYWKLLGLRNGLQDLEYREKLPGQVNSLSSTRLIHRATTATASKKGRRRNRRLGFYL